MSVAKVAVKESKYRKIRQTGGGNIKKSISLNKLAALSMLVVSVIILILLACMDWYLIADYQSSGREKEKELISVYAEKTGKDMEEINAMLYEVHAYNSNFNALSGILPELEEYDNVYELDQSMRNKVVLEDKLHGYMVYYSAVENIRYYMDTDLVNVDDIDKLKEIVKGQIGNPKSNWQWIFAETDTHTYGLFICRKNNVSLCTIYSLSQMKQKMETAVGNEARVFFIDNGNILADATESENPTKTAELLSPEDRQELLLQTDGGGDYFRYAGNGTRFYGQRVKNSGLWICMAVPVTIWSYLNLPQMLLLFLTAGSVVLLYILYRYLRRELLLPLSDLTDTMNRIRDGEWDARTSRGTRFTEIQKVNEAFEVMVSEIKKQKMLSYEQTIEKQKAQMQYLQLQLKPHFYLNGLKTLNVLSMNKDTEKMQELIMKLSYHLRYLLQAERELVPVYSEIDYVKNYVELQESMTGRPFGIEWDVQLGLSGWLVPNLCIQTFVENSFKYAKLGSAGNRLIIRISVNELETEEGVFLDILIQDNGAGYPENILEEINHEPTEGSPSVGINNLKRRCRLLYANRAEYAFYNEEGAVSELILPEQMGGREHETVIGR